MRFLILLSLFLLTIVPLQAQAAPRSLPPPVTAAQAATIKPIIVTPKMRLYSETGYALYFIGTAYSLLLLWGVLTTGVSARLRTVAERLASRFRFLRLPCYYLLLTALFALLEFPLTFYDGYWLEHANGLSQQTFGNWWLDAAKGRLLDAGLMVVMFALLFWLIKRSPRRWSLWFWGLLIPIIAFGIFLEPLVIDPLFNKFTPMPPSPLRTQIEQLATQAGIPDAPIYIVDKSRQTNTTNAYVTGIGSSARIVIWDTTLKQLKPDEIRDVIGHEMGHYVLKHIYWGFAEAVGLLLILLPLAQKIVERLIAQHGSRWRLRGLTDPAAIPVFLLVLSLLTFFTAPLTNALSRQIEHAADAYGLEVTGDRLAMARAFTFFAEHDLSDPNPPPFIKFWLFSHPPIQERINFALGRKK